MFSFLKRVPNPFPSMPADESDDEEWHDAADAAETPQASSSEAEAGPSSRPVTPAPLSLVEQEADLKVSS